MARTPHILLVEDDPAIARLTAQFLEGHGYRTSTARDGGTMDRVLATTLIDLVVLDIMLPGREDGFGLCRRLRTGPGLPIIMLTARGEMVDRVVGLELGADDYLAKPFSTRELLARIRAVLRRYARPGGGAAPPRLCLLRFAGFRLDRASRRLLDAQGRVVTLTGSEYELLLAMCERPGVVLTRDQLLDLTRGRTTETFDRSIDTMVSRLRQKIEPDPREPRIIRTARLAGYVFAEPVEEA